MYPIKLKLQIHSLQRIPCVPSFVNHRNAIVEMISFFSDISTFSRIAESRTSPSFNRPVIMDPRARVRPEIWGVLAGESPVPVSAGAPGSRLQPGGEIRPSRPECRSLEKEREQTSGPYYQAFEKAELIISLQKQQTAVWAGTTVGTFSGSQAVARWERLMRNRSDPTLAAKLGKDERIRLEG